MGIVWTQLFPLPPTLTEANLASQQGKLFLVTGGNSGVGWELCRLLYQAGGKVYLCGRSARRAEEAIAAIQAHPDVKVAGGELVPLIFELDDLASIKPAVEQFNTAEQRLDVLFLNAGVATPPCGSVSKQGHELSMAVNCLSHQLLAQLLVPKLVATARTTTTTAAVRVIWTSSIITEYEAPLGGFTKEDVVSMDPRKNYTITKTANWFQAHALAQQIGNDGVLSIVQNPGNLKTQILRHVPSFISFILLSLFHPSVYGAYTGLWAALSPDLVIEDGGRYIVPWGRPHPSPRQDLLDAMKSEEDGGSGLAAYFVDYCNREIRPFL